MWVQTFAALIRVMLIEDRRKRHWFHLGLVEVLICCCCKAERAWLPKTLPWDIHLCTHKALDSAASDSILFNPLSLIWIVKDEAFWWSKLSSPIYHSPSLLSRHLIAFRALAGTRACSRCCWCILQDRYISYYRTSVVRCLAQENLARGRTLINTI